MVLNRLNSLLHAVSFNEFRYNPDVSHIAISGPIGIDTIKAKNLCNRLSEEFTVEVPRKCQGAIQIEDDQSFHWLRIVFSELPGNKIQPIPWASVVRAAPSLRFAW